MDDTKPALLGLTVDIVSAFVAQNALQSDALPGLIQSVHNALGGLDGKAGPTEPAAAALKPAVSIRNSVQPDFIVCLEDGKKLKMMKRYLRAKFDMSPEEYRVKWRLPADYPMVAPNYSERRSNFAKTIGLGRGVRANAAKPAAVQPSTKSRAPRKPKA